MGTVYRGWDPLLNRWVALKTVDFSPEDSAEEQRAMLERLHSEARAVAPISHPNVVTVHDMGGVKNAAFIAMELVEGQSLASFLRLHPRLGTERLLPLATEIAGGLAAAHQHGVVHRDIKPGNVLLGVDGAIKVVDFGLAYARSAVIAERGYLAGTPGYVAPEVLDEGPQGAASDLYGLGVTLYECLAGVNPLCAPSLMETLGRTLRSDIAHLAEVQPGAPTFLTDLVMELLNRNPQQRPTAEQVGERLMAETVRRGLAWSGEGIVRGL